MAQQMICLYCHHIKNQHGTSGCSHRLINNKTCDCNITREDPSMFVMGDPKND